MSNIILLKFSKLVGNVLKPRCAMGKSLGVCLRKKCLGVYGSLRDFMKQTDLLREEKFLKEL